MSADPRTHEFKLNATDGTCKVCSSGSLAHNQQINVGLLRESLEAGGWTSGAVDYIVNAVIKQGETVMKTLLAIFLLLILSLPANAVWEMPHNPDRFPSFGVNYSGQNLTGDRHEVDSPNPLLSRDLVGDRTTEQQMFGGDFRFPFSESGTLMLGVDSVTTYSRFTRQDGVYHENEKLTGFRYSIGLRVYVNR